MKNSLSKILFGGLLLSSLLVFGQRDSADVWVEFKKSLDERSDSLKASKMSRLLMASDSLDLKNTSIEIKKELSPVLFKLGYDFEGLRESLQLANSLSDSKRYDELFEVYKQLANYYGSKNLPENSLDYVLSMIELTDSLSKMPSKGYLYYRAGILFKESISYDNALNYLGHADTLAIAESDTALLLKVLRLKAKTYEQKGDYYNSTLTNERILLVLNDVSDSNAYTNQLNNLGFIEQRNGNSQKALDYFLRTLFEREVMEFADESHIPLLINIGISYQNIKYINESKIYLERALVASKNKNDTLLLAEIYDLLSIAYLNQEDLYNAKYYNQEGLNLVSDQHPEAEMNLSLSASLIYEELLKYDEALFYYKRYLRIKDSLSLHERLTQEEVLQQKIYVEKTEKEVRTLVAKNELKDYQLEQLRLESENKDIQLENQRLDNKQKLQELRLREAELEKERTARELESAKAREENQKLLIRQQALEEEQRKKEIQLLENQAQINDLELEKRRAINRNLVVIVFLAVLVMILALFAFTKIRKSSKIIASEKKKSDTLLLNILPESTAEELKSVGQSLPRKYESVTVLFTDFKGFTKITETMQPESLVDSLALFFAGFDDIMKKYGLEKIKTIGDAYMCAGGIPEPLENAAEKTVLAAKEMLALTAKINAEKEENNLPTWGIRIGLHTGPVVAGVIGNYKFQYDIWGDTVNLAARMESSGEVGMINVSEATYNEVKGKFNCTYRGEIAAKNKGNVKMYFIED